MRVILVLVAAVCALLFAFGARSEAQQKVYRIAYLSSGKASPSTAFGLNAFRQRLRELGYTEGQNLVIEYRYGELDPSRLSALATEVVNLKVDVILTSPDEPPIRAAQLATRTIPIVMPGIVVDPLEPTFWGEKQRAPLVASLAKPGGNFTGLTNLDSDLHAKRLELLKEAFPLISRVALLWPRAQQQKQTLKDIGALRQVLGIEIQSLAAGSLDDFERSFTALNREPPDALLVARSQVILNHRERVIGLATKRRLPAIFASSLFVEDGGLMSYGADTLDLYRRAATYVDKILKGAKPGELPIERPMKFEFVVNLKTIKQLGLTMTPNVLARADKVIR
ncbi:MAG TPA: ABC transporter substrate-binding protein [Candidatus Binatia bacterium]|nr:ABC transporter substrate-binding protein [Candidatus Binatia bacterium]